MRLKKLNLNNMPKNSINHGSQIVRDYQQKKLLGKIKTFLSNLLSRFLLGTSIGVFVLAGFFTGNALVGFNGL